MECIKIENTKYMLGQHVYVINNNQICRAVIVKINKVFALDEYNNQYDYVYYCVRPLTANPYPAEISKTDDEIYLTKEEIIKNVD